MANLNAIMTRARIEGLVILLVAIGYLYEISNIPSLFQTEGVPGPAAFPAFLGVCFCACGLWLLLFSKSKPASKPAAGSTEGGGEEPPPPGALSEESVRWRFYTLWAVILGYMVLMPTLGFIISTPLALAALFLLLGTRLLPAAVTSLIVTAATYACFAVGLRVQLPHGLLTALFK